MSENLFDNYSIQELLIIDIQFLGLKKKAWEFSRGARTMRTYLYDDDTVGITDSYDYIMSEDNREILEVIRVVRWFDSEGNEKLSKDISPEYNIKGLQSLNREIRQGRIDYLESAGVQLSELAPFVPSPYAESFVKASNAVPVITKYYQNEIDKYVAHGTLDFERLLLEESNPIIVDLLATLVRPPDEVFPSGLDMKQSITHQLKGSLE